MVRILAFLLMTVSAGAQASDWRYAGTNVHEKEPVTTFVDISSIERHHTGTVRAWIKTITRSSLLLQHRNGSFIDRAKDSIARKIGSGYVPPYFLLPSVRGVLEKDALLQLAMVAAAADEYLANDDNMSLAVVSKMLLDIHCESEKMTVLSVTRFDMDGNPKASGDTENASPMHLTPHYQREWISQMACR